MGSTPMMQLEIWMTIAGRVLVAAIFLPNAFGFIDRAIPARQIVDRGLPNAFIPLMMLAGRTVELLAGTALALGIFPRPAALAPLAFIVSATFIAHAFWLSAGQLNFQAQLVDFFKNVTTWGRCS
jgi:putative oxidoreductase